MPLTFDKYTRINYYLFIYSLLPPCLLFFCFSLSTYISNVCVHSFHLISTAAATTTHYDNRRCFSQFSFLFHSIRMFAKNTNVCISYTIFSNVFIAHWISMAKYHSLVRIHTYVSHMCVVCVFKSQKNRTSLAVCREIYVFYVWYICNKERGRK